MRKSPRVSNLVGVAEGSCFGRSVKKSRIEEIPELTVSLAVSKNPGCASAKTAAKAASSSLVNSSGSSSGSGICPPA